MVITHDSSLTDRCSTYVLTIVLSMLSFLKYPLSLAICSIRSAKRKALCLQPKLRNHIDNNGRNKRVVFTKRSGCHGDNRCFSFFLNIYPGCRHYASRISRSIADRRDTPAHHSQTFPPSHQQHGPARRTAGGGDNTETSPSQGQPTVERYTCSFLFYYKISFGI